VTDASTGPTATPNPLWADAVALLSDWSAPDAAQERLRVRFLEHLRRHPDAALRSCRSGHLTASTLLFDATARRVLLTLHPFVGTWLQLGGHCEAVDSTLRDTALREATEESGIEGVVLRPELVRLSVHPISCRDVTGERSPSVHYDLQYAGFAPPGAVHQISDESDDLRWFDLDDLPADLESELGALVAEAVG
jgi:8-oxo-dGTP pyrophosphatase MutT (NUDIX family)